MLFVMRTILLLQTCTRTDPCEEEYIFSVVFAEDKDTTISSNDKTNKCLFLIITHQFLVKHLRASTVVNTLNMTFVNKICNYLFIFLNDLTMSQMPKTTNGMLRI